MVMGIIVLSSEWRWSFRRHLYTRWHLRFVAGAGRLDPPRCPLYRSFTNRDRRPFIRPIQ